MYYRNYLEKKLDAELLSGLITAVSTISAEILESGKKSKYTTHIYQNLSVTIVHGQLIMIVLIAERQLPKELVDKAYNILTKIESKYANILEKWTGDSKEIIPIAKEFEELMGLTRIHSEITVKSNNTKYKQIIEKLKTLEASDKKLTIANLLPYLSLEEISLLNEMLEKKIIVLKKEYFLE